MAINKKDRSFGAIDGEVKKGNIVGALVVDKVEILASEGIGFFGSGEGEFFEKNIEKINGLEKFEFEGFWKFSSFDSLLFFGVAEGKHFRNA